MQCGSFPVESGLSVALATHPHIAQLLEKEYTYTSFAVGHLGLLEGELNLTYRLFFLNISAIYLKEISLFWKKSSHHK